MESDILELIAKQQKIRNVINVIRALPSRRNGERIEQYVNVMKGIALEGDSGDYEIVDSPLYQIAVQMKLENVISALTYLISTSDVLSEQRGYYKSLEAIVESYSKENGKGKSF